MRRILWTAVAVVLIALGLSFAMLNSQAVALNFYLGRTALPLSLWMVVALATGAVLGVLSTFGVIVRQRRELARLRRRVNDAQKELSELRKMPIRNTP